MTIQAFSKKQIYDNPYQTRDIADGDPEIAALAVSIQEHGLQNIPKARPHPDKPGCVQLVEGHRRRAAWFIASSEPMPVAVDTYTERQMFDLNVIENKQREDMTVIETARQMLLYTQTFNASQSDTGKLFGYASQGAVSNVVRLLKLPEAIHSFIGVSVPERLARKLLPYAGVFPKEVTRLAKDIAKVDDDEKEDECDSGIRHLQWSKCKNLNGSGFNQVAAPKEAHPKLGALPACKGCEFAVSNYCTRVECFSFKTELELLHRAKDIAKNLGIAVVTLSEKGHMIFDGESEKLPFAKAALKLKHESLRLMVSPRAKNGNGSWNERSNREHVLGSGEYALATVDLKDLTAALPKEAEPKKISKAEEQRLEKEQQKKVDRDERVQAARKKEVERLKKDAVKRFASKLPSDVAMLRLLLVGQWNYDVDHFAKQKSIADRKEIVMEMLLDSFFNNPDQMLNVGTVKFDSYSPDGVKGLLTLLAAEFKMHSNPSWYVMPPSNGKNGAKK